MSKEYKYIVEECSCDTRRYTVTSDRKLTYDEIQTTYANHTSGEDRKGYTEQFREVSNTFSGEVTRRANGTVTYEGISDFGDSDDMVVIEGREHLKDE